VDSYAINDALRDLGTIEEIHIFSPTLVNTARFGYNHLTSFVNHPGAAINPQADNNTLNGIPGFGPTNVTVTGLTTQSGGVGAIGNNTHNWHSFQFYDDLNLTRGTHALKFGFAIERMQDNELPHATPFGGFSFNSLTAFLLNQPLSASFTSPIIRGEDNRQTLFGGYVQDDWRLTPGLTVNLGLRYEMVTLPKEENNQYMVLLNPNSGVPVNVDRMWAHNATYRNFAPRVGFAWDPFHDGKTAIRGAFGIYDVLPLSYVWQWTPALAPPFNTSTSITFSGTKGNGTFPYGAISQVSFAPISPTTTAMWAQQDPKRSYVMNWNLNVQRSLTGSTTLTVGFVGSKGTHLPTEQDSINEVLPSPVNAGAGWIWPFPVGSGTRRNPLVGSIRASYWDSSSSYSGLKASLVKRMGHGFQIQGSYAWGRCFDDGSYGGPTATGFYNDTTFSEPRIKMRGPCAFDLRQVLTISYIWQLPAPKFGGQAVATILGGWQLAGVFSASTGEPFSVGLSGNTVGQNDSNNNDAPNRLRSAPGCDKPWNPGSVTNYIKVECFSPPFAPASMASQCSPFTGATTPPPSGYVYCANLFGDNGRGTLTGPGLSNFDFSIYKTFRVPKISEAFNVQFRTEMFNVLNHPNFQPPADFLSLFTNTGAPVAGAGAIDATTTTSRQIQFGLKVVF
jgi:hypothetical protein